MPKFQNFTGKTFGKLTVESRAPNDKARCSMWNCVCVCGERRTVRGTSLTNGNTRSCGGCFRRKYKRGTMFSPEYRAYVSAKGRCENPTNKDYPYYGGAGVRFLFSSFAEWLKELGPAPSPRHSVDRIGNGNYAPGKVRWATRSQQAWHRRKWRTKTTSTFKGVTRVGDRWQASITCNGEYRYLGTFSDEEQAAETYDAKARERFSPKFACLNFPEQGEAAAA